MSALDPLTPAVNIRSSADGLLPAASAAQPQSLGTRASRVHFLVPDSSTYQGQSGEPSLFAQYRIAVLVPCYNEAATVASVVAQFQAALPGASVYVYDNNSTDRTAELARSAGAEVRRESRQGKGIVVRRMFSDIDADIYVLVDGDATYDALSARDMIARLVQDRLDMVVAVRVEVEATAYRAGHRLGNLLLTSLVASVFGRTFTDMLSGYRVFTRRFVKSIPLLARGFEIETELTVHALELGLPVAEIATPYYARPKGSASKLNTWRDGLRILWTIAGLQRSERPLLFFTSVGGLLLVPAILLAMSIFTAYEKEGVFPGLPAATLTIALTFLAVLSVTCGLVLATVTRGRREAKLLAYLQQTAPGVREELRVRSLNVTGQGGERDLALVPEIRGRVRRRREVRAPAVPATTGS